MTSVINGAERQGPKGLQSMRIASVFMCVCKGVCTRILLWAQVYIHDVCVGHALDGWYLF